MTGKECSSWIVRLSSRGAVIPLPTCATPPDSLGYDQNRLIGRVGASFAPAISDALDKIKKSNQRLNYDNRKPGFL
jgi:hypothetical protein